MWHVTRSRPLPFLGPCSPLLPLHLPTRLCSLSTWHLVSSQLLSPFSVTSTPTWSKSQPPLRSVCPPPLFHLSPSLLKDQTVVVRRAPRQPLHPSRPLSSPHSDSLSLTQRLPQPSPSTRWVSIVHQSAAPSRLVRLGPLTSPSALLNSTKKSYLDSKMNANIMFSVPVQLDSAKENHSTRLTALTPGPAASDGYFNCEGASCLCP